MQKIYDYLIMRSGLYGCCMHKLIVLFACLVCFFFTSSARQIQHLPGKSIEAAMADIELMAGNKIPDNVKLVGLGDAAALAYEPVRFNTTLAAFLIRKKGFRNFLVMDDNWMVRPLHHYLSGTRSFDSTVIDSLVQHTIGNFQYKTTGFRTFLYWLKKYNLLHQDKMVSLRGIGASRAIPISYFMITYIYPLDKENGTYLSKKWGVPNYPDSLAVKDVEAWYKGIIKNKAFVNKNKALLAACAEDLAYYDATSRRARQTNVTQYMDLTVNIIGNQILQQVSQRSILYTSNDFIARSNTRLDYIPGRPVVSYTGMYLHQQLKEGYFACLTGFSDTARLLLVNRQAATIEDSIFVAPQQEKLLYQKKDRFFIPEDTLVLKQYLPAELPIFTNDAITIVPDTAIRPLDALFLFKYLSPGIKPVNPK